MRMFVKSTRTFGTLLYNILIAVLGTAVVEAPFTHLFGLTQTGILTLDVLAATASFGVGYFVYYKLRSDISKWVWVAGLCWWGQRIVVAGHTGLRENLWEAAASSFTFDQEHGFETWGVYTIPLLRTLFYSFGAVCCSRLTFRGDSGELGTDETVPRGRNPDDPFPFR
jgi:hypothetical protein